MFDDLVSRFSKARKIKWLSFLQTKGSILLKRKSIISFDTQWVKIRIFVIVRFSMISFKEQYWPNLGCSEIWACSISTILSLIYVACSKFCHCASMICVFYKVQVMGQFAIPVQKLKLAYITFENSEKDGIVHKQAQAI